MLTTLSGGLLGLLDRRLILTAWLPVLLLWGALGALVITGEHWSQAAAWWLRQPAQFQVSLLVAALACVTFSAYVTAALIPVFLRVGEGYWPSRLEPLAARCRRRQEKRREPMEKSPLAFARLHNDYPTRRESVMPTRLGNVLRAAEDYPLIRYNIDAVVVWPRLYLVLPDQVTTAIAAAKTPLDLMAVIGAVASAFAVSGTVISAVLLPWYAPFACLAGGLAVTWFAYAGAVQAARPYAQLIRAAFDVHRGLLLDAVGLSRPQSLLGEREQWEQITHLWYQGAAEKATLLGYPATSPPPPTP
jgi:hypothetical protein